MRDLKAKIILQGIKTTCDSVHADYTHNTHLSTPTFRETPEHLQLSPCNLPMTAVVYKLRTSACGPSLNNLNRNQSCDCSLKHLHLTGRFLSDLCYNLLYFLQVFSVLCPVLVGFGTVQHMIIVLHQFQQLVSILYLTVSLRISF